ncbi:sigma-70 family RNA polymerase sigma factor [Nonomuraea antri]|uniref:sigma-70 family RNA polymerase sigma factor n=1 Tax=Nonomuraea antri TaxID=2730852 RepID=UPI002E292151|nr:sigma-70 family RNA polymerase sigma factor [Nonomuraea antri]
MTTQIAEPGEEFARLTGPYRDELLKLCYRMVGSVHDAEDLVQETYLRAWRSYETFAGRSSLRTWLYRIATNACLRAAEQAGRRPLPSGLSGPGHDPAAPLDPRRTDLPWLQPFPTATPGEARDPAEVIADRASLRLALIAALQVLPPRQRAVLILRDVLMWRAAEVAELLGTTVASVTSLLQRARTQLDSRPGPGLAEPTEERQRELLRRYVAAFERADVDELTRTLAREATFEMPPIPTWFAGRETVARFLAPRLPAPGRLRIVHAEANGQPALALYLGARAGDRRAHALHVLDVSRAGIVRIVAFMDPAVFSPFGLPQTEPVR